MLKKTVIFCLLLGVAYGEGETADQSAAGSATTSKREAEPAQGYSTAQVAVSSQETEPKPVYGPPSSPESYSKSIPAAAIRNVETVAVTKTITPVVTKTTTYNTHSEPALSIGHVQGYSQSAVGHPKIAPVQFQTQYTSYLQPTVGVNGPVTYTGPAVVLSNGAYAVPVANLGSYVASAGPSIALTSSSSAGNTAAAYVAASGSNGLRASYGPPSQSAGTPLGSYSTNSPQYVAFRPSPSAAMSLLSLQQLQQLRAPAAPRQPLSAMASAYSPVAIRAPHNPYAAFYQSRPISPVALTTATGAASSPVGAALRYQYQHRPLASAPAAVYQRQPISQPTTYVQTYTMPSVSYTTLEPVNALNKASQTSQQATITKAISN